MFDKITPERLEEIRRNLMNGMRLGEALLQAGLLSRADFTSITKSEGLLCQQLVQRGLFSEDEITSLISHTYGVPAIDLDQFQIPDRVLELIPKQQAEHHCCIPINHSGATLVIAMADPSNIYAIDDLRFMTGYQIEVVVASPGSIRRAIARYYGIPMPTPEPGLRTFDNRLIPLEHVKVEATIKTGCGRVDITQRYRNSEREPIEAIFTFRVDDGAAMCHFEAKFEDRVIVGEVDERESAFERYDDAVMEGKRTALLDQERPDLFTARLGNLPPGQTASLHLSYVQTLPTEGSTAKLIIPTTVAPRYIPLHQPRPLGEPLEERLNPPEASDVPYGFELEVSLEDDTITMISSPTHKLDVHLGQPPRVHLHQQESALDRDIVLALEQKPRDPSRAIVEKQPDGTHIMCAFLEALTQENTPARVPVSVTFILDCSGSMAGDAIVAAREFVASAIEQLDIGDTLQLICFGSSMRFLWNAPQRLTQDNKREAIAYVKRCDADMGGTEIFSPIRLALTEHPQAEALTNLVVITDGAVSNEQEVIDFASAHAQTTRVFTYGVGHAVSQTLVRELARVTHGKHETFSPHEENHKRVARLLEHLGVPTSEHHIEWGELDAVAYPTPLPLLLAGEQTTLLAKINAGKSHHVELVTEHGARRIAVDLDGASEGELLGLLWAREAIRALARDPESHRERVIDIAKQYNLASPFTSFVLAEADIDHDADDAEVTRPPATRRIPVQKVTTHTTMAIAYDDLLYDFDLDEVDHGSPDEDDIVEQSSDAPVIRLVNATLLDAIKRGATRLVFKLDHHERHGQNGLVQSIPEFVICCEITGELQETMRPPVKLALAMLARFEVMAGILGKEDKEASIDLRLGSGQTVDLRLVIHETPGSTLHWEVLLPTDDQGA